MKLFFAISALAVSLAVPAYANHCMPAPNMEGQLIARYGETVIEREDKANPKTGKVTTFQMWANRQTGTWTLTGKQGGTMCVFKAGKNYDGQVIADFLTGEAV